jgi:methionyl-tRNA synthetase
MKKFYITTAIDYANSRPHIGHAYEKVISDIIARYKRLRGYDVYFTTGTDEHSSNVAAKAKELGKDPKAYCDEIAAVFKELCAAYNISINDFIQTTETRHAKSVTELFTRMDKNGDIYEGHYEGWYCRSCESFYSKSELTEDGLCKTHKLPVDLIKEENHFLKMTRYTAKLQEMIEKDEYKIRPQTRRNEILSMLKHGYNDISVSRANQSWGIRFPKDEAHTVYVWFDALINYITAAGFATDEAKFKKWWPADLHMIGKDIIKFHCIIWPIMLMSAGLELPKQVYAHGFLLSKGEKMSKTRGNVVDPFEVARQFGCDAVRYFFAANIINGVDGDLSADAIKLSFNTNLANDLGNLINRSLNMVEKYCGGAAPAYSGAFDAHTKAIEEEAGALWGAYSAAMEEYVFSGAMAAVWKLIGTANKLIELEAPWNLQKNAKQKELDAVMYILLEVIRLSAAAIAPVMPGTSAKIFAKLGLAIDPAKFDIEREMVFGKLAAGTKVSKGEPLFPRIEK